MQNHSALGVVHEVVEERPTHCRVACAGVDAAVLFSSISTFLGGVGQSNYSAANAALDAYASFQQAQGVAGRSVQWGTWCGVGMAMRDPSTIKRIERIGLGVVMPDTGLVVMSIFSASPNL